MVKHSSKIATSLLIVLLFTSISNSYGALVRFELEQMWEEADSAVHGKVVKMTTFRDTHFIYTNVEIEVIDFYIRDLDSESVNVTVHGGIPSIEGLGTEDQPWFYIGEEVFVFLWTSDFDNDQIDYFVFGAVQGKYTVEGDRATGMRDPFTLPNPEDTMDEQCLVFESMRTSKGTLTVISFALILCMVVVVFQSKKSKNRTPINKP